MSCLIAAGPPQYCKYSLPMCTENERKQLSISDHRMLDLLHYMQYFNRANDHRTKEYINSNSIFTSSTKQVRVALIYSKSVVNISQNLKRKKIYSDSIICPKENERHTTVLCLLGRKTLTMGFWGERGLARLASVGVWRTAKLQGAEVKAWAPPPNLQPPILTSRIAGMREGEQEKSVPLPVASSSCCSLCCRASSLLVYSS